MVMYRTDLMEAAGLEMPDAPSWDFIREAAIAMTDRDNDIYGVCLRGKPGWGENMAFLTAASNSFGARWFDEDWVPQFDSEEWASTLNFYLDLMNAAGPPGAAPTSGAEIKGKAMATQHSRSAARFMMAPAVFLLLVWMLVPLTLTLWFSFMDYRPLRGTFEWGIGFGNYTRFLTSSAFQDSVLTTLIMVGGILLITVIGGVLLALLLDQPIWGQGPVRILDHRPADLFPDPVDHPDQLQVRGRRDCRSADVSGL